MSPTHFKYETEKKNFDIFFLNGTRILLPQSRNIASDEHDEPEVEFV